MLRKVCAKRHITVSVLCFYVKLEAKRLVYTKVWDTFVKHSLISREEINLIFLKNVVLNERTLTNFTFVVHMSKKGKHGKLR